MKVTCVLPNDIKILFDMMLQNRKNLEKDGVRTYAQYSKNFRQHTHVLNNLTNLRNKSKRMSSSSFFIPQGPTITKSGNFSGLTSGKINVDGQIISTLKTGISPFIVSSNTLVPNLRSQISETVVTNANLMGQITSVGNETTLHLTPGHIFIGNGSGVATEVFLGGDASLNEFGLLTLENTDVISGNYGSSTHIPVFNVDSKGRIISVKNTPIKMQMTWLVILLFIVLLTWSAIIFNYYIFQKQCCHCRHCRHWGEFSNVK
jgi:hypothetical protein